jgi:hypothetical protein
LDPSARWTAQADRALGAAALLRRLEARRAEQRALLLDLLEHREFPAAGDVLVADIGWRGSIQDNLCRLLPQADVHGCYFLLLDPFMRAAAGCTRQSYLLPDPATARRLRFGAPLELAVGCEQGTVLGYRRHDASVEPVEAAPLAMTTPERIRLAAFRAALADAAVRAAAAPLSAGIALRDVLSFLERPPTGFAALYFASERDERFGVGRMFDTSPAVNPGLLLAALVSRAARNRFGRTLADSGWPWALLRRDLRWLLPVLRPLLLRLDLRLPGAPRSLGEAGQREPLPPGSDAPAADVQPEIFSRAEKGATTRG